MSFIKRLFSSDHRAAKAAEAAGDFELAAQRYALAGQRDAAVRMHLIRADRAPSRALEIDALRDALHWAEGQEEPMRQASMALGKALMAQAQAEGIHTERDRARVREAAELMLQAKRFEHAGDAYLAIGDDSAAMEVFRAGGLVAKLEHLLSKDEAKRERERAEKSDFADYDLHMRGGARDLALIGLRRCLQSAGAKGDYRRLLDELESRLITSGRVRLKTRCGRSIVLCSAREILLGRDALCDLVVRTGGVSRRHARIQIVPDGERWAFELEDAGSRNGTRIGGMPIASAMPLVGKGSFFLGEELELHYLVKSQPFGLTLTVRKGLDSDAFLLAAPEGELMSLAQLGVDADVYVKKGRPILRHPGGSIRLNSDVLAHGDVQLIHGDVLVIGGIEIEVA